MPVRILVYGAIWVNDRLVVHRRIGDSGTVELSLPGGDVHDRGSLPAALAGLIREQIDCDVEVRELLWAGREGDADIILVFDVRHRAGANSDQLLLMDPRASEAVQALPAVLRNVLILRGPPGDEKPAARPLTDPATAR